MQLLSSFVPLLIAAVATFFFGWALWGTLRYGYSLLKPRQEIVFVPFEGGASDDLNRLAPAILSAKLRELTSEQAQVPAGWGFLNVPHLSALPGEANKKVQFSLEMVDRIQLKVKDVDVSALIKFINAIFTPVSYELRGTLNNIPNAPSVTGRLVLRGNVEGSWEGVYREGPKPPTPAAAGSAPVTVKLTDEVMEDCLDQILYQMIFDFVNKPQFAQWRTELDAGRFRGFTFRNWQSLRAYVRGMRALRTYKDDLDHASLLEARDFFEMLTRYNPDDPYGLYFYGLALSENRQEAEAMVTFRELQRLLKSQAGTSVETTEFKQMRREAELNEAGALLRLYEEPRLKEAIGILDRLIADLLADVPDNLEPIPSEKLDGAKLLAAAYAQLGYTHGTRLSFMRRRAANAKEWEKTIEQKDSNLDKAEILRQRLEKHQASAEDQQQSGLLVSEEERRDLRFRINNARGYSIYRQAQLRFPVKSPDKSPDKDPNNAPFRAQCEEALGHLQQANADRPNHYEILQNIAMIYADRRYDPDGTHLAEAKHLFERTAKFVPNDYYQYEQLADIYWREVEPLSTAELVAQPIELGRAAALAALKERPQSGSARVNLARFAAKSWETGGRTDQQAEAALRAFDDALLLQGSWPELRNAHCAFLSKWAGKPDLTAAQLDNLAERALKYAGDTSFNPPPKTFVDMALQWIERSLKLTADFQTTPALKPEHERGEALKEKASHSLASAP